jgi:hypothetical protein
MSMVNDFLLYFDAFGVSVSLLQKKRERYNTILGGILSLAILSLTLVSFITMLNDLFSRSSANIVSKVEWTAHPEVKIIYINN